MSGRANSNFFTVVSALAQLIERADNAVNTNGNGDTQENENGNERRAFENERERSTEIPMYMASKGNGKDVE